MCEKNLLQKPYSFCFFKKEKKTMGRAISASCLALFVQVSSASIGQTCHGPPAFAACSSFVWSPQRSAWKWKRGLFLRVSHQDNTVKKAPQCAKPHRRANKAWNLFVAKASDPAHDAPTRTG